MIEQTDFVFSHVLVVWITTATLLLILLLAVWIAVWPRARRILHAKGDRHPMLSRAESRVGLTGEVTTAFDPISLLGRISVEDEDWAAKCSGLATDGEANLAASAGASLAASLAVGEGVEVIGHDGIVLFVKSAKDLNSSWF